MLSFSRGQEYKYEYKNELIRYRNHIAMELQRVNSAITEDRPDISG